jgi:hypothetical protein
MSRTVGRFLVRARFSEPHDFTSSLRSRLLIDLIVTGSSRSSVDDGVDDREGHAAQIDILLASYDLIYLRVTLSVK